MSRGGAERRYYELAKRLSLRHEVHLFGMKFWQGDDVVQRDDGVFLHGVCPPKELYVDGRRSIYQAIYFSVKLMLPLLKQDFDIVDCSSVPLFPIFTCKLYTMVWRKSLIVTWHEYWNDYWYKYLETNWKGFIAKTIELVTSKLPDRIVAVSEHTKIDLVSHKVPRDKVQILSNGIDYNEIQLVPVASNPSDVIFVGRLIKDKNVDVLMQVICHLKRSLPKIKCYIIGDGPERRSLGKLRVFLGLEENVKFLGFLNEHQEVYSLMKASKVFVLPSEREGFGVVVPEANACGLPVVVVRARHSAASSLVKSGESGIVCDLDARKIADIIYKILVDDVLLARMQQSSLRWARQFDWYVTAEKTEQVYQQLIGF